MKICIDKNFAAIKFNINGIQNYEIIMMVAMLPLSNDIKDTTTNFNFKQ